jgi:hypothetical protein
MGALLLALVAAKGLGCTAGPADDERRQIHHESTQYRQKGSGSISGIVAIETGSGRATAPSGTLVYLTPATSSVNARLQEYGIEKNELPEDRFAEVLWMNRTDAQGRVRFDNLPPGEYVLVSQVAWRPPSDPAGSRSDVAYARVRLAPGENIAVTVSRRVAER